MTYTPPVEEQKFLLDHVGWGSPDLLDDRELVEAIVEGAGAFAAGEFAPLNRIGDEVGAKWSPEGVTMPPGFKAGLSRLCRGRLGDAGRPAGIWRPGPAADAGERGDGGSGLGQHGLFAGA